MPNIYYYSETHYNYHTNDEGIIFSSEAGRQRSYEDEYDWYIDACEEFDLEPEYYDD